MASSMRIVFIAMVCLPAARGEVINGGAQPVSKPAEQLTPKEQPAPKARPGETVREQFTRPVIVPPVAVPREVQRDFLLPSTDESPNQADRQGWRHADQSATGATAGRTAQTDDRIRLDTSDVAASSDGSAIIYPKKPVDKEAEEADGIAVHVFMAVIGLGSIGLMSWCFSRRKRFA